MKWVTQNPKLVAEQGLKFGALYLKTKARFSLDFQFSLEMGGCRKQWVWSLWNYPTTDWMTVGWECYGREGIQMSAGMLD